MIPLDEKIEQVRLDFVEFYQRSEWLNALQAWKTYYGLRQMNNYDYKYDPLNQFPELKDQSDETV